MAHRHSYVNRYKHVRQTTDFISQQKYASTPNNGTFCLFKRSGLDQYELLNPQKHTAECVLYLFHSNDFGVENCGISSANKRN